MHADDRGVLWVATGRELLRVAGGQATTVSLGPVSLNQITDITADGDGGVWLHDAERGLQRWNRGRLSAAPLPHELKRTALLASYTDRSGRAWLAFENQRVAVMEPSGNVHVYGPDDGLTAWDDAIRGRIEFPNERLEDVVLVRSDGRPTYNFASPVEDMDDGITHVTARFGYMDTPDVPAALRTLDPAAAEGPLDLDSATYFLSKIELRRGPVPTMALWRKRLFVATSYITADAAEHFGLPRDRTIIMGSHIDV